MALHKAEQIIVAITNLLKGLATTKNNVFRDRDTMPEESELPCLLVNAGAKTPLSEFGADNIAFIDAFLDVSIDVKVQGLSKTTTVMNKIAKEVHVALMADQTLSGLVFTNVWKGDSEPLPSADGNQEITTMTMDWTVKYRHSLLDPSQ